MDQTPNILFIVADDMGYGDIGCFGNPHIRTPRLDQLSREGVTLTQHYSASPLCAPARAALLTGRYNHRTGAVDVPSNRGLDRFAIEETTIADVFSAAGYATGLVGKWHNGLHDMRYHPNNRGLQEFLGFLNGGMDYYNWSLDRNGSTERSDGRYLTDVL
jgi:arylsulfatase A